MRTEEELIYDLLEIITGGVSNDDSPYSERLMRSFLRKQRAQKLTSFFKGGYIADDMVYQDLGDVVFEEVSINEFSARIPAIIGMEHNLGIYVSKMGFNIPIVSSYAFEKSKNNFLNSNHPKAKLNTNNLVIFKGLVDECCSSDPDSLKSLVVDAFNEEYNAPDDAPSITANVKAILYDPSEAPNYDWTRDPYPCPSEIIDTIETSVKARDLNLMIRVEKDQVTNQKSDNIQFDDTNGVR